MEIIFAIWELDVRCFAGPMKTENIGNAYQKNGNACGYDETLCEFINAHYSS